jgi:hypothetical protein
MPADQNPPNHSHERGDFRHDISEIESKAKRHPHCSIVRWHMRSVSRTSRSALALFVAAFALFAANRASGQLGGTGGTAVGGATGTSALANTDFTVLFKGYFNGQWVQMNSTTQQYYFNQARCLCDTDPNGEFEVIIQPNSGAGQKILTQLESNLTGGQGVSYLFAGTAGIDCLNPNAYYGGMAAYCTNLLAPGSGYPGTQFSTMAAFGNVPYVTSGPIPVAYLFNSLSTPNTCGATGTCDSAALCTMTGTQTNLQFWVQTLSANGVKPDFDPGPPAAVSLVGSVPVTPMNVVANPGNEALNVTWDWGGVNIATDTTLVGVQIFCQRGADNKVFPGFYSAAYQTPATLCKNNAAAVAAATTAGSPFSGLDPNYLCSGLIPATSTSHRITGLQNGIWYGVGVAAVDRYGNIGAIANVAYGMPIPTVDFYTYYKNDAHGAAQGGYCALSGRHVRPGLAALLFLAGLSLALGLRHRSKRRPPGAGTLVVLFVAGTLTAREAHAQVVHYDDSLVEDRADEVWNGSPREFAIEARFGLYLPDVDSEFGGKGNKPQAFIFGNKRRPMWQLEFDWEFLQEFGTLALGGVIGYYKENAQACTLASLQQDPNTCGRSGDNTGLRLIPLAVLLVYRLDEAATRWKIPLVPYAKVGLNYTIWTITNGNGDVAWSGDKKGQGGTMGWQAAVGLSLELDFLDPGASREFDADSGVNHTYAFFELDHVDGSGLYRKDVLRVGDNTWFTGLMFEF